MFSFRKPRNILLFGFSSSFPMTSLNALRQGHVLIIKCQFSQGLTVSVFFSLYKYSQASSFILMALNISYFLS